MTRIVAALLLALGTLAPAAAADRIVHLTLDGRPVDRDEGVAVLHDGLVYASLTALVRTFDGLMSWKAPSVWVTVNGTTAVLTPGSRAMRVQQRTVELPGEVIRRNGDFFVPLDAFVTQVAHVKVRHPSATHAEIVANADPLL